jgi:tetratricopeptide (TPR) repeat protein
MEPTTNGREPDPSAAVPNWLMLLVLALVVGVVAAGLLTVQLLNGEPRFSSPAERDIHELSAAVKRDPSDTETRTALGYAYQRAGRYEDAVREYDVVLATAPEETAALYNKGVSLLELGRPDEAEEAWRRVLEIRPAHALAAKALGVRLADREQWADLAEVLLPVVQADERTADLQALLGRAYEELGDYESAERHYRLAITYNPRASDALAGLRRLEVRP